MGKVHQSFTGWWKMCRTGLSDMVGSDHSLEYGHTLLSPPGPESGPILTMDPTRFIHFDPLQDHIIRSLALYFRQHYIYIYIYYI